MSKYRKFFVALGAAVGVLATALTDGVIVSDEIESVVVALVGALFVFLTPNDPVV